MSRQDSDVNTKFRSRANTAFASSFNWPQRRKEPAASPPVNSNPPLSVDTLLATLSQPSAAPNLGYARALASLLPTHSPLPPCQALLPILNTFCRNDSPSQCQVAGFDILAAYWESSESATLGTADRLVYFSLFLGSSVAWSKDLWEPRFKALRALTKFGTDIVGNEIRFLELLKSWINGAFEAFGTGIEHSEEVERERSIAILSEFLTSIADKQAIAARVPEQELRGVVQFYAQLVDRFIANSNSDYAYISSPPSTSLSDSRQSTPARPSPSHRRHASSVSLVSGLPSPTTSIPPSFPTTSSPSKSPSEIAIDLYLKHLEPQLKTLSSSSLQDILPVLFRALSSCAVPLTRLSIPNIKTKHLTLEDRIADLLNAFLSGPYSISCMSIVRRHLSPPPPNSVDLADPRTFATVVATSFGAQRTLRNHIRRALTTRLARAYISRQTSISYSPSGAPGTLDIEQELMQRAYSDVGLNGWDAGKVGKAMADSVESWVELGMDQPFFESLREGREKVLAEVAGTLKDIFQELDDREEDVARLDEEESVAVGTTLYNLAGYVLHLINADGTPFIIHLTHNAAVTTPLLHMLSAILSRDHTTNCKPSLSETLLRISRHLTDVETAKLPAVMANQHDVTPTSPDWLETWSALLDNPAMVGGNRPLTTAAVMAALWNVYESVRDMPSYRAPLADVVFEYCQRSFDSGSATTSDVDDCHSMWRVLGDEIVLRTLDISEGGEDDGSVSRYLDLLNNVASQYDDDDADTVSVGTADTRSSSPQVNREKDKDKEGIHAVMSLFSSLAGTASRSQSTHPQVVEDIIPPSSFASGSEQPSSARAVGAVASLISVFCQLSFTPSALIDSNLRQAFHVYDLLMGILKNVKQARVRLTILQFLMRLRADRDHRVYFVSEGYDVNGQVYNLASLIGRTRDPGASSPGLEQPALDAISELRKARSRMPHERDGRRASRGRGAPSSHTGSRSRSRVPAGHGSLLTPKYESLWHVPESLPFEVVDSDIPSEALISYDPLGPGRVPVLAISEYLGSLCDILEKDTNWEILSYVLCHLPVQLANKHLFCGPKARVVITRLLMIVCNGVLNNNLVSHVERWPPALKAVDAQGLAYHTISVLVGYRRCFDLRQSHVLVEALLAGLDGQPPMVKISLHALCITAFELQASTTKFMSDILEKLSRIMSNPHMAVHILGFLNIIGSHPPLYANFTDDDFKTVFGVALQYLQHHNQNRQSPALPWALSQHVRILSFGTVYVWFLAVKLADRPKHIPFITRQLLLANEESLELDSASEVCFDWLARYTYGSADPRPATSLFSEMIMNSSKGSEPATSEKTWIVGNSLLTIRTLARLGWIEVVTRRPSGYLKFICRLENAPMIGPGDVDPDLLSISAGLVMDRSPPTARNPEEGVTDTARHDDVREFFTEGEDGGQEQEEPSRPDPISGYVWSKTAPSQRRKEVEIDPSFFALQLSGYPQRNPAVSRYRGDATQLKKFLTSLDWLPVIDTHKIGVLYVSPGQIHETEILKNTHGSPAYSHFMEGIGRLIDLRGQMDVYAGGLNPTEDGAYAYAWWDDIGQILFHTATMMPNHYHDPQCINKKSHIGNDYVRIVWNDGGRPYRFDTLKTHFQFTNIVIEPHSLGAIAAFSNNPHETEYFKVTVQSAEGMAEFAPIGEYKLISAQNLPMFVRQLCLLSDWYASVFARTAQGTVREEIRTNWQERLLAIRRFKAQHSAPPPGQVPDSLTDHGVMGQQSVRDFTNSF